MAVTPQGVKGEAELYKYWAGEGRSRWAASARPWSTLQRLLFRYMTRDGGMDAARAEQMSKGMATKLHKMVFGDFPGNDTARVRKGHEPRGKVVGPG